MKFGDLIGALLRRRPPADTLPGTWSSTFEELVVRTGPHWYRADLRQDRSCPVSLPDLLEVMTDPPRRVGPITRLPDTQLVTPVWAFAAHPTRAGLVLEDPEGRAALLDSDDVRLLDRVLISTEVGALAAATGIADAADRASRLVELGLWYLGPVRGPAHAEEPAGTGPPIPRRPPAGGPDPGGPPGRIPVYAPWHPEVGPLLALGMLTAAARAHRGGALNALYEIRRPETAESVLEDLARRTGPAILLASDYVWSLDANLATARSAIARNPELLVIHGGPSCPKYERDAAAFLERNDDVAHVLTRGEGEHLICELLEKLAPGLPRLEPAALRQVEGITFRDADTGEIVRTPDRPRIADLDALPSPYLTGEFDHIDRASWNTCLSIETNRGCPYSCSFCDWGSSTMSRIRKFGLERVTREIEWAAQRGISAVNIPDANFGIMARDVDTALRIAEVKQRTGFPNVLVFYPAKNTTKHFVRIMDVLSDAGITSAASLSLQTTDEATLDAIDRSNISTDHFVALAADYRRRGHPLLGDLLLGVPGQTYESYRRDLQFMLDQEILVRTWPTQILPNAPMNDPEYRERHQIVSDSDHLVTAAASFTPADRARMVRLRKIDIISERMGLLRHVLRYIQWEHAIEATAFMDRLLDLIQDTPERFPHLTWTFQYFDLHPMAPAGWRAFYEEVESFIDEDLGIPRSSALTTVIEVNRFLMPCPGRTFPQTIDLEHDYVSYFSDARRGLWADGHPTTPTRSLATYGPGLLTVEADPLFLCDNSMTFEGDSRDLRLQGEFQIGSSVAYELQSPLLRLLPRSAAAGMSTPSPILDTPDASAQRSFPQDSPLPDGSVAPRSPTPVSLGARR